VLKSGILLNSESQISAESILKPFLTFIVTG
jgi:hypothetical protein